MRIDGPQITGSFSIGNTTFPDINALATTGSNTFIGNQVISGSIVSTQTTLISGSSQVLGGTGIFSSSAQLPSGIISGSSQLPTGIVSSSAQVIAYGVSTTGSNTFQGNQIITGSLFVSQDLVIAGSSSIQYISSSVLNIDNNIITVNAVNPSVRFGGLAVIDSGSSPQVSGSMLFDSINNQWLFVHQNQGTVTSSVLLMGPETYNNLGNETYITQNRLVKSTGIEHLSDSNITDTGTKVSINSNTEVTGSLITTGAGTFNSTIRSNATNGLGLGSIPGYRRLQYDTNGTKFGFLTDGDALANLEVGGATFSGIVGVNGLTEEGWALKSNGNLKIESNSGTTVLQVNDTATGGKIWSLISSGTGNTHSVPTGTFYLRNSSDSLTALSVTSGGNVGIGTSGAAQKLQINGPLALSNLAEDFTTSQEYAYPIIYAGNLSGLGNGELVIQPRTTATRSIRFVTRTSGAVSGTNPDTRMIIRWDGNVGIGTTSPSQRFHVANSSGGVVAFIQSTATNGEPTISLEGRNSSGTVRSATIKYDNADLLRIGTSSPIDFRFETNDIERMRITSSGRVGVGTSSPGSQFSVVGDTGQLNGNYRYNVTILQDNTTARGVGFGFKSDEQLGLIYGETSAAPSNLAFLTYSGSAFLERMRITSGGRVGIGTGSPQDLLDVNGSIRFRSNTPNFTAVTDNGVLDYVPLSVDSSFPRVRLAAIGTSSVGAEIRFLTGTPTSLDNRMTITAAGNVGIGTTSPSGRFHVTTSGITASAPSLGWPVHNAELDTNARSIFIDTAGNNNVGTAGQGATVALQLGGYWDSRVVITPTGNGSSSPGDQGTGRGKDLMIKAGTSDNGAGFRGGRLYLNGGIGFQSAFNTNGGDILMQVLTGSGNVGIATTSPQAKLHIADALSSIMLTMRSGNDTATGINFTSSSPGGGSDNYTINHTILHGSGGGYRIEHNVTGRWIRMIAGTGGVELAGAATSWTSISDIRKKDVLQTGIPNALDKINNIDAIFYKYKNEELLEDGETLTDGVIEPDQPIKIKQRRVGLIAQQIHEVLPEAINYNEEEDVYKLSYTEMIPLLVEAIKEQQTIIGNLKSRLETLENN